MQKLYVHNVVDIYVGRDKNDHLKDKIEWLQCIRGSTHFTWRQWFKRSDMKRYT